MLGADATVFDVIHTLTEPEAYIRRAYRLMVEQGEIAPKLSMRLGISGSGQKPYFRLVRDALSDIEDGPTSIVAAFYDNGEPLKTSSDNNSQWSSRTTSFQELEDYLRMKTAERKARRR